MSVEKPRRLDVLPSGREAFVRYEDLDLYHKTARIFIDKGLEDHNVTVLPKQQDSSGSPPLEDWVRVLVSGETRNAQDFRETVNAAISLRDYLRTIHNLTDMQIDKAVRGAIEAIADVLKAQEDRQEKG